MLQGIEVWTGEHCLCLPTNSAIPKLRRHKERWLFLQGVLKKWPWNFFNRWENISASLWFCNFHRFLWKSHLLDLWNYGEIFPLILEKHKPKLHLYPMSTLYSISFKPPLWHTRLHNLYIFLASCQSTIYKLLAWKRKLISQDNVVSLSSIKILDCEFLENRIWGALKMCGLHGRIPSVAFGEMKKYQGDTNQLIYWNSLDRKVAPGAILMFNSVSWAFSIKNRILKTE